LLLLFTLYHHCCTVVNVAAFSIFAQQQRTMTVLPSSTTGSDVDGLSPGPTTTKTPQGSSPVEFVQDLLSTLSAAPSDNDASSKGQCLLDASSESWRRAIHQAIGAPIDVQNTQIVAKALHDSMIRQNNQFAILMGSHGSSMESNDSDTAVEPFVPTFPSDVVDYRDDGTAWLECRLRHTGNDALLVTMGIQLIWEQEQWKIVTLDWQDFRPQFYPGLSGREWLRSF
jgi:hypothetical protein